MTDKKQQCEIGMVGLGVMGRNFLLNTRGLGYQGIDAALGPVIWVRKRCRTFWRSVAPAG